MSLWDTRNTCAERSRSNENDTLCDKTNNPLPSLRAMDIFFVWQHQVIMLFSGSLGAFRVRLVDRK